MPITDIVRDVAGSSATILLVWACISDVRTRRIPNLCVLALIVVFVPWALAGDISRVISSLEAAGVALAVTFLLYLCKVFGAGDSKLFTACALFAGIGYLPFLALATVLSGGVIALASILLRPQRALVMFSMKGKGDYGRGVPYGVAVAVGAAVVIWGNLGGFLDPYGYGGPTPVTSHAISKALSAPRARP